jgi:hypothetical protein
MVVYNFSLLFILPITILYLNIVVPKLGNPSKIYNEPTRDRTWNLLLSTLFRRQTRYPLRHRPFVFV